MSMEDNLMARFADVFKTIVLAQPDLQPQFASLMSQWSPRLLTVRNEPGRVELEFKMSSERALYDDELAAVGRVLGGTATCDTDPDGGCDSCGYGARVWVTVALNKEATC